jgi:alpha-L-arabinofuranosidase
VIRIHTSNADYKDFSDEFLGSLLISIQRKIMAADNIIRIFPEQIEGRISPYLTGACIEDVNHEIYGGIYSQMIFGESFEEAPLAIEERLNPAFAGLSGTVSCRCERTYLRERSEVCSWQPFRRGSVRGDFRATILRARRGRQSQKITFLEGEGEVGIENQGLNRWGLNLVSGKPYEGCIVLLSEAPSQVFVSLESRAGDRIYARTDLDVPGDYSWHCFHFSLIPSAQDPTGRFTVTLQKPGSVWVDYVLLQPGEWGRFHNLPVRTDIGQGLVDEGLTVLRYGGYMINTDWEHEQRCPGSGYRWKKALGARADRPPYLGTFYAYNTSGFGIPDFAAYCEAAGFLCIPAINPSETPQDAADLVEYLNGSVDTPWGARRAADGHAAPFCVRYLQIGNEESIPLSNGERAIRPDYPDLFLKIFKAVTARDPSVTVILSPWLYKEAELSFPENRPAVEKLLAAVHGHAVLWDVHVGGDNLHDADLIEGFIPRLRAFINEIDPQNQVRFCILEENGTRHDVQRALGHAHNINVVERLKGEVVLDCAANCLQAYHENDHFWDQGQLFYTPNQVWGMPPYTAQQMIARHYQPLNVRVDMEGCADLDVTANRSEDGKTVVVKVVNLGAEAQATRLVFEPQSGNGMATIECLSEPLDAENTPEDPYHVVPTKADCAREDGIFIHTFPAYSFTLITLERL